jgi:citrate lyase subunit beta / citryl-CoA lyase
MTVSTNQIETARSLLFVPGHRPDRFAKAASAGANLIIIDLEDAVAPQDKDVARGNAAAWLTEGRSAVVRINAPGTPWCDADLDMAASYGSPVMIPKAEDAAALEDIACRTAGRCPLIPLIETAAGVEKGHPGVRRHRDGTRVAVRLHIVQSGLSVIGRKDEVERAEGEFLHGHPDRRLAGHWRRTRD